MGIGRCRWHLQTANSLLKVVVTEFGEPGNQLIAYIRRGGRVDEQSGSNRQGTGASQDEFCRILPVLDTSHCDDWYVSLAGYILVDPIHKVDRKRSNGRSGKSARPVGQSRATMVNVDRECRVGIDHAQDICAAIDRGTRCLADITHIG